MSSKLTWTTITCCLPNYRKLFFFSPTRKQASCFSLECVQLQGTETWRQGLIWTGTSFPHATRGLGGDGCWWWFSGWPHCEGLRHGVTFIQWMNYKCAHSVWSFCWRGLLRKDSFRDWRSKVNELINKSTVKNDEHRKKKKTTLLNRQKPKPNQNKENKHMP